MWNVHGFLLFTIAATANKNDLRHFEWREARGDSEEKKVEDASTRGFKALRFA
jgi:hypothetical protein